jgi:hypothetical protein
MMGGIGFGGYAFVKIINLNGKYLFDRRSCHTAWFAEWVVVPYLALHKDRADAGERMYEK